MKTIIQIITCIAFAAAAAAQNDIRLGVLDFQAGAGVAAGDAKTITDILRSELVSSKQYLLVEREKVDKIMSEQGFQNSGCTESECAAKVGKLLNIQKMLFGTVSKLGTKYYVIANMISVETAAVERSVKKSIDTFDGVEQACKEMSAELIGGSATGTAEKNAPESTDSKPQGKTIAMSKDMFSDEEPPFKPSFSMSMSEGGIYVNNRDLSFANSLSMHAGGIYKLSSDVSLFGLYQFMYDGPGLRPQQDSEALQERSQDHVIIFKYLHNILPTLTVKGKFDFMSEFYKLSKNEAWAGGLYDFQKYGLGGEATYTYFEKHAVTGSYTFSYFNFPNYTDMQGEFLTGNLVDQSISRQSHLFHSAHVEINNSPKEMLSYRAGYTYTLKDFIADGITGSDGVFVTGKKQRDMLHTINIDGSLLFGIMLLNVGGDYENYVSSMYYIIQDGGGTNKALNYDYMNVRGRLALSFLFTDEISVTMNGSFAYKNYPNRVTQSIAGAFTADAMNSSTVTAGMAWSFNAKPYRFVPGYIYKYVTSNNKFTGSGSYNYFAHGLSLNVIFDY
ncbi:MAG: hypothetical protein HZC28_19685 [Spirochaetes bacterium]|nr:hypothetical protein [Spirochaetota bacterium]